MIHGWGADADDLLSLGNELIAKTKIDFEIISLRAPSSHPSNTGRQWYSLFPHDWNGAKKEVESLFQTLKNFNTAQIPLKKTILLGFSQGAAMAIDAGCNLDFGLIVSCSGYPHPDWLPNRDCPPMIISHGSNDEVVPINASRNIYKEVTNKSVNSCQLIEFDGFHQIDLNLINIIHSTIKNIF